MLRIGSSRLSGRAGGVLAVLTLTAAVGGCDILSTDVENPNVVVQEDIERPAAASALVGGTLNFVTDAMGQLAAAHSNASDEVTARGSFDVIYAFDRGELQHNDHLWSTDGYTALAVGRWMGDETVGIVREHGTDVDASLLPTALWLTGFAKATAAEVFEAFALSDRQVAGPVADRNALFDAGIADLAEAVTTAQAAGETALGTAARAYQARALWAKALHAKCSSASCDTASPLVNDAAANALATQVLAGVSEDWEHLFTYSATTVENELGFEVNSRREVVIEDHIIQQSGDLRQSCWPQGALCQTDGIRLMDPIDNIQDPALRREAWKFLGGFIYTDLVGVSARELRLILAEAALATSDMATFATHINAVRGLASSLSAFDPGNPAHTAIAQDLLVHMRQVNLFLQVNRRLMDQYRFDIAGPEWQAGELALSQRGTVFPLGKDECVSNPEVNVAVLCN